MSSIQHVCKAINQIVNNAKDSIAYPSPDAEAPGVLKREEGNPITDYRVNDNFTVRFASDKVILMYSIELPVKEYYKRDFELNLEQTLADLKNYVQKEYRKMTKQALNLKAVGDMEHSSEYISNVKQFVTAIRTYSYVL